MGKLVLFLADGSTLPIRLDKERITIGRRADNDVCLPYPAVSGEHAAVVTILSDSFLEDLGSTNGTLVNGKTIAKHFLRDRDQIAVGREKLVFLADDDAVVEPTPKALGRLEMGVFGERVEPARVMPSVVVPPLNLDRDRELMADLDVDAAASSDKAAATASDQVAAIAPPASRAREFGPIDAFSREFVQAEVRDANLAAGMPRGERHSVPSTRVPDEPRAPAIPVIKVLSGPNAGRSIALDKAESLVGRVGLQVAAIRKNGDAFRLILIEGSAPPSVNGEAIGDGGVDLVFGDVIEVANTRLEFVAPGA